MAEAAKKADGHPSGDERYKAIDLAMKRFKFEKDALLEVLNTAQETFGFLSEDLLIYVSTKLGVPLSQVYGVSTFYHMFTFEPLGEHNCIVCAGTACHVKGGDKVVEALTAEHGLEPGETTPDGMFSLTIARCIGSCGLAPVLVLDGKVMAKQTPDAALRAVDTVLSAARAAKQEEAV